MAKYLGEWGIGMQRWWPRLAIAGWFVAGLVLGYLVGPSRVGDWFHAGLTISVCGLFVTMGRAPREWRASLHQLLQSWLSMLSFMLGLALAVQYPPQLAALGMLVGSVWVVTIWSIRTRLARSGEHFGSWRSFRAVLMLGLVLFGGSIVLGLLGVPERTTSGRLLFYIPLVLYSLWNLWLVRP